MVQRPATKQGPEIKDLEYEENLKRMELPSLRYRRTTGDMTDTYKHTHTKYTVNEDLLVRNEDNVARGHSLKLQKRYCGSARRFKFYSFRIVDSWNYLKEDIIMLLHWIRSKKDWINVGLARNSFAPNWIPNC